MQNRGPIIEKDEILAEPITPVKSQVICEKFGKITRLGFKGLIKAASVIADVLVIWYVIKH